MDFKETTPGSLDGKKADKYIADEFGQTGKLHFQSPKQKELELARFKQNCRAKALDWAMDKDYSGGWEHILKCADKYYEWLTKESN